jgi:hypothetical protein
MKQCLLAFLLALMPGIALAADAGAPLQFRVTEGNVLNAFYRQGPVAAHLLLSSGRQPRVLVAFRPVTAAWACGSKTPPYRCNGR